MVTLTATGSCGLSPAISKEFFIILIGKKCMFLSFVSFVLVEIFVFLWYTMGNFEGLLWMSLDWMN